MFSSNSHASDCSFPQTDRSQEGNQFVKGFGGNADDFTYPTTADHLRTGIGGLLRYKVDFGAIADAMEGEDEFYDSDEEFI